MKTIGKCLCIPVEKVQIDLKTFHPIERSITGSGELPEQPLIRAPRSRHLRAGHAVVSDPERKTMEVFQLIGLAEWGVTVPVKEGGINGDFFRADQVPQPIQKGLPVRPTCVCAAIRLFQVQE